MRRVAVLFALLLSPLAATAQNESVTIEARTMEGVWQISGLPNIIYCRIARAGAALTSYCTTVATGQGRVEIENGRLHMSWGDAVMASNIDGALQSSTEFTGKYSIRVQGALSDYRATLTGKKLALSTDTKDAGGRAANLASLLEHLRAGTPGTHFVTGGTVPPLPPSPEMFRALGAVQAIIYLGPDMTGKRDTGSVYAVEFDHGERLCSLHQYDDGVLDRFLCI